MTMNIGDRVRLIHSSEQGVIVRILDNRIVEVEIEDGFHIPVKQSEIVVIAAEESTRFGTSTPSTTSKLTANTEATSKKSDREAPPTPPAAAKGIYCALVPQPDQRVAMYLLNNTDYTLAFALIEQRDTQYNGLSQGTLAPRQSQIIADNSLQNLERWGAYIFQFLQFKQGNIAYIAPAEKRLRVRRDTHLSHKTFAPLLQKEAYLIQLDAEESLVQSITQGDSPTPASALPTKIDPEVLRTRMLERKPQATPQEKPIAKVPKPSTEIDLHVEQLTKDYAKLNSAEILTLQLQEFETQLENAIANAMSEIVFIHGVGNGKLRQEIHKRLGSHEGVKFFKDARREKFGYGATHVSLK